MDVRDGAPTRPVHLAACSTSSAIVHPLLSAHPSLSAIVFSADGRVLDYNLAAVAMFAAGVQRNYRGLYLSDLCHPGFAQERVEWLQCVARERRHLQVEHVHDGYRVRSNFVPSSDRNDQILVISRRVCSKAPVDAKYIEVETAYADFGSLGVLTTRELQVLIQLGQGMSVAAAAETLGISPKTLEKHKTNIGRKLGESASDRIVRLVTQRGLQLRDTSLVPIVARRNMAPAPHLPALIRTDGNRSTTLFEVAP